MKKLKIIEWILLLIAVGTLIGCVLEFQRRSLFLYYCLPLIFSIFFLLERRIRNAKKKKIKKIAALFMGTILAVYCSIVFYVLSIPIGYVRDTQSEIYLEKMDCFEQLSIPSMNGNTDGWLYKQSNEKAPLIIFFTGAGECSAEAVRMFYENGILLEYFPGYNFLSTDYPSYGISDGYTSEGAIKELALDTYDTAIQWDFVDESNITVMGYSFGTGPASYLAARRDLASLVMLAPYDIHWDNTVRNHEFRNKKEESGIKKFFYGMLYGYRVDPYKYAESIMEPTMIIASLKDTTIIHEASMRVANRIENCQVTTMTDIKHENLLCDESYDAIHRFLYR